MAKIPKISDAEWKVMEVIWREAPVPADKIVEMLSPHTGWNPSTIKTMINRLIKKDALRYELDGKRYIYRPAVTRQACVKTEGRSFVRRVFGGDVAPMLAHFVEDAKLTPDELAELRKMLEKKGR
jgi:BlaI family penicillinase repressor